MVTRLEQERRFRIVEVPVEARNIVVGDDHHSTDEHQRHEQTNAARLDLRVNEQLARTVTVFIMR